jgi:large subunit ribosomal protein L25
MEIVSITAHQKEGTHKEGAKKTRRTGLVPAVMYKSGGGEAISFAVSIDDYRSLIYTAQFKMAEITLDGKKYKCILKDVQFHPVSDAVIHIDFLELVPGVKFKAEVPLVFEGSAPGVKAGGKFITTLRAIKVLSTPETAVDKMVANISTMELGSTIRVRDIKPVDGVTIMNTAAVPVAVIEIPRALRGK